MKKSLGNRRLQLLQKADEDRIRKELRSKVVKKEHVFKDAVGMLLRQSLI